MRKQQGKISKEIEMGQKKIIEIVCADTQWYDKKGKKQKDNIYIQISREHEEVFNFVKFNMIYKEKNTIIGKILKYSNM